jgi:hypothetical protein
MGQHDRTSGRTMAPMPSSPSPVPRHAGRRRPFALVMLAGLFLLKTVVLLLLVAGTTASPDAWYLQVGAVPQALIAIRTTPGTEVLVLVVAGLLAATFIGLLAMTRVGWLLAMMFSGVFVAFDIVAELSGTADHLWMALNIVTVFYLNQQDLRDLFGATAGPAEAAP